MSDAPNLTLLKLEKIGDLARAVFYGVALSFLVEGLIDLHVGKPWMRPGILVLVSLFIFLDATSRYMVRQFLYHSQTGAPWAIFPFLVLVEITGLFYLVWAIKPFLLGNAIDYFSLGIFTFLCAIHNAVHVMYIMTGPSKTAKLWSHLITATIGDAREMKAICPPFVEAMHRMENVASGYAEKMWSQVINGQGAARSSCLCVVAKIWKSVLHALFQYIVLHVVIFNLLFAVVLILHAFSVVPKDFLGTWMDWSATGVLLGFSFLCFMWASDAETNRKRQKLDQANAKEKIAQFFANLSLIVFVLCALFLLADFTPYLVLCTQFLVGITMASFSMVASQTINSHQPAGT